MCVGMRVCMAKQSLKIEAHPSNSTAGRCVGLAVLGTLYFGSGGQGPGGATLILTVLLQQDPMDGWIGNGENSLYTIG